MIQSCTHVWYYNVNACLISGHPYWEATAEKFHVESTEEKAGPSA